MSDTNNPIKPENRWHQAFRESRAILFLGLVVSAAFMAFAANTPELIRKVRTPTAALNDTTATPSSGDTVAPISPAGSDTGTGHTAIDSPLVTQVTPIDSNSGATATTAAQLEQLRKDSIIQAKARAKATADSLKRVQEELGPAGRDRLLAQVAAAREINTEITKRLFDLNTRFPKSVQFIDARPEHQFEEGHIPGSMNIYGEQWQSHIPQIVQIPRDQHIVVYCGGGKCELSHELADHIRELGFSKVSVYTGGTNEWTEKSYPMSK